MNHTTVYLAWKEEGSFYSYRNTIPVGTIKVLKPEYYTAQFRPGNGTGEMEDITAAPGGQFILPDCSFTAPDGRAFYKWRIEAQYPVHVAAGETILRKVTRYSQHATLIRGWQTRRK